MIQEAPQKQVDVNVLIEALEMQRNQAMSHTT